MDAVDSVHGTTCLDGQTREVRELAVAMGGILDAAGAEKHISSNTKK